MMGNEKEWLFDKFLPALLACIGAFGKTDHGLC